MSDIAFGNTNYFIAIMSLYVMIFIGRVTRIEILSSFVSLASSALYIIYCVKISMAFGKSGTPSLFLLPKTTLIHNVVETIVD